MPEIRTQLSILKEIRAAINAALRKQTLFQYAHAATGEPHVLLKYDADEVEAYVHTHCKYRRFDRQAEYEIPFENGEAMLSMIPETVNTQFLTMEALQGQEVLHLVQFKCYFLIR